MRNPSSSLRIREHVLDLVWSLWAEMGVSSWTRRHAHWAVDPEPLILITSALVAADPRLRDESIDWCIQYGRYVSVTRLKNLLRDEPEAIRHAFGTYAAVVNAHSALCWPSQAKAAEYHPTGRSSVSSFASPALIGLRLRALFGVSARADILRALIAQPQVSTSASDLVSDVNHTKRNIDKALDSLRIGGLLEVVPVRNEHRYRIQNARQLLEFVGDRPEIFPRWSAIFRCIWIILETTEAIQDADPHVRMVEARRVFRQVEPYVEAAGLIKPRAEVIGDDAWCNLAKWTDELTAKLATGDSSVFR
jgi:DNA-binding transcriptional ArsR family regulator